MMRPGSVLCDPNARIVIAHRGNRVAAAENTIESLAQAIDLGADAVEFDVRVTRDGVPVILHDADLDRTTNGHGRLDRYTFAEIRSLDAAARAPKPSAARLQIPSLEEVLTRFRETPLVIEVKELAAAEPTEAMIRRFGAQERVLIGSSDNDVTARFYRSGLRTCASTLDAAVMIPLALAGVTPAKPRYDVLSITPNYHGLPIPVLRMTAAAHKAGVATQVWTINDPEQARRLWAGGVAGIVTDDPAALIRARAS
jgi:glycerophosphoryl diester phosphodiesterase